MVIRLARTQLVPLIQELKTCPGTLKIVGEIEATLENRICGYEYIVDRWPDCRAIVILANAVELKFLQGTVNLYATDNDALMSLLHNPDVMNWSQGKRFTFAAVDSTIRAAVLEVMHHYKVPFKINTDCVHLAVTQNTLKLRSVPEGYTLSSLQPEQAPLINSLWKFSSGDASEAYIKHLINKLPSACLYDEEGVLLGYALTYTYGYLGMLHVLEEHRGKGYGKVIMSQLALKHLKKKKEVYVIIECDNAPSLRLHGNMGFEVVPDVTVNWIVCTN
ncbi:glycine N-acyltransferase-like protein 3 [Haliotis rufescens]|uniref:glycine N-acyltransferase-like protein 3 n=1 Tax=Haliotis rufescens TaxID=6454 RepID=UPI00201F5A4F|nr:glycine N-acyltransferase-like protein 3 [Haliotis rufescens]XP_046345624.2 glycine N-acyltransferase-like protein 3 [Haliotis rufescens]XP_046345632.2 glycine N-acyltransferase-like protein 3 [Haliotis rufescens]XP_048240503.1 glycine N-acyltransferase-like protein 3 [Haliotis rufescens]